MRILFYNILQDLSVISATNLSLNYPVENIYHVFKARRFQASTTSSVITITFSSDQQANCFFYGLHNLSALSVVYKDSGGSTLLTVTPSSLTDIGREYFSTVSGIRSIEITLTTAGTYVYLGSFSTGIYYDCGDFINSWTNELIDNGLRRKNNFGYVTSDKIDPLRAYGFEFPETLKADADAINTQYVTAGKLPVYIDITPGDITYFAPIYAEILEPPNPRKLNRRFRYIINIEEAR